MATSRTQEASSSTSHFAYQVFLSFRGKEIRRSFIDHLYTALVQAGIHTFRDDEEIGKAEDIKSELRRAIEQSRISIVVLSKDYASSNWCLDELLKILERRRTYGHVVLPIFYDVDRSQVRNQTGSFAEALAKHEGSMKEGEGGRKSMRMDKVRQWREALREVADLDRLAYDGHESRFIQEIVKEIRNKLNIMILNVATYPVGLEPRIKNINLWLQDGSNDVGVLVIYGMGGIGKTTIAKAVYNLNFDKFDGYSFLANIKESLEQPNSMIRLLKQLLSDMVKGRKQKIHSVDEGITKLRNVTHCKRVLLVLDDVDESHHLRALNDIKEWLYSGSKIIITTRHKKLLKSLKNYEIYNVEELDDEESLQLFSWHAFKQDYPLEGYEKQTQPIVAHCGGLPLALQVLGSSLFGKSVEVWESALRKLKAIPAYEILSKLKISYDYLEDDHDKNLFLDIACFFIGKDKDFMVMILDGSGFYTTVGIQNLMNRSLITLDEHNKIMMHQLIRDMGREIIRQESPEEPGERSRLWNHKDSIDVLEYKTGTEKIEGIALDMHVLEQDEFSRTMFGINTRKRPHTEEHSDNSKPSFKQRRLAFFSRPLTNTAFLPVTSNLELKTDAFARMQNLRLLQLSYVHLAGNYEYFPKKLRWLRWNGFLLNSIPCDFTLDQLIALDLRKSSLKQAWKGIKSIPFLKILNLSYCHGLTKTPDFSGVPNLEQLILKECVRLVSLNKSIGVLKRLGNLNLRGCKNLRKLPREICMIDSLEELILSECSNLEEFPEELWRLDSLKVLTADDTAINRNLGLSLFRPWLLKSRTQEFSSSSLPRFLVKLSLMDCNLLDDALPTDLTSLPSLQKLYLGGNPFESLPKSLKGLTTLQSLQLDFCRNLQSLPQLPSSLRWLNAEECLSLERITNLPNWLGSLRLDLPNCTKLVEINGIFRLEPIAKVDPKLVSDLGVKLEFIEGTEVNLCNNITETQVRGPVQGLFEFDILSIFLPGCEVPGCFEHTCPGSSVSFSVSSLGSKIGGLSVCLVYSIPNADCGWVFDEIYLTILNQTKNLNLTYSPMCFGNPEVGNYMVWLCHWMLVNELEDGDQVSVSVSLKDDIQVKECGVHVLDKKEDKATESYSTFPNTLPQSVSVLTSMESILFCHYDCQMRRQLSGYDHDSYNFLETSDEDYVEEED